MEVEVPEDVGGGGVRQGLRASELVRTGGEREGPDGHRRNWL